MRNIIAIILIGMASTAYAQSNTYLPQNRQKQTEAQRYEPRNQLADVRLDPHAGRAVIALPQTQRPIDYLELRAGRMPITLVDVEVRFADGTSINTGDRGRVAPFEGRVINLPRHSAAVTAIIPTYRTAGRYRPARLQVFGVPEHNGVRAARSRWNIERTWRR
jgi:hypothetical protein